MHDEAVEIMLVIFVSGLSRDYDNYWRKQVVTVYFAIQYLCRKSRKITALENNDSSNELN